MAGTSGSDIAKHIIEHEILGINSSPGATVSGVSDHGALTGLSDDDHVHYYNQARLDIVLNDYATTIELATASGVLQNQINLKQDAHINLDYLSSLDLVGFGGSVVAVTPTEDGFELITVSGSGAGITNGDKGDITVSLAGTLWRLDKDSILSKDLTTIEKDDFVLFSDSSDAGSLKRITVSGLSDAIHKNLSLVASGLTTGNYTLSGVNWDRENFFLSAINAVTTSVNWNLYLFADGTYDLGAITTLKLVDKGFRDILVNPYVNYTSLYGNIYIRYEGSNPADFLFLGESR